MKNANVLICYRIVSPFHILSLLTYLKKCSNRFDQVYIIINNYWGYNILENSYFDFLQKSNFRILSDKDVENVVKENKNITFLFVNKVNIRMLKYFFIRKIHSVTIEDGLGAYNNFIGYAKAVSRESKGIIYTLGHLLFYPAEKILKRFLGTSDFRLFLKKGPSVNLEYKNNFKSVMNDLLNYKRCVTTIDRETIIFCTQPFIELGLMSNTEMNSIIQSMLIYARKKGCQLLIKKHPAEKIYVYDNRMLIDYSGALEEIVYMDNSNYIKEIVGFNSTSLLNCSAIFDKKCLIVDTELNKSMIYKCSKLVIQLFNKYTVLLSLESGEESFLLKE